MAKTTLEKNTKFNFLNNLLIENSFNLRSVGCRNKLFFTIYGVAYYDTGDDKYILGSHTNKGLLLKMYRSFSVDKIVKNLIQSLWSRFEHKDTALFLPALSEVIKKNYSAFNYKDELFMRFDYLNEKGPSLYLYKVNNKKYIEFAIFNNVPDLMMAILKCYFDSNSVAPNLRDNFK